MTAPGWYNAEGDPPGSQRYWDGGQWIGEPVFEPAGSVAAATPSAPAEGGYAYVGQQPGARQAFPTGLKTLAIVVSVLKAIPLVIGLIAAIWLATIADEADDAFDEVGLGLDGLLGAAIAILFVIIVIGALLLGFHFWGAIKERAMMLFIPALIMSLLDILSTIGSWNSYNDPFANTNAGGAVIMTVTMIAQVTVAIWAIRVYNARN